MMLIILKKNCIIFDKLVPSSQLLVFNVKEGWDPLCTFLEKPVPEIPFPKKNAGAKKV